MVKKGLSTLFIVINVLLYLLTIGIWISIPDEIFLNITTSIITVFMTLSLIIYHRKKFYDFYTSQYFKTFSSYMLSVFLGFIILGFINYLAYKNPIQWDISQNQRSSLTDQSRQILKGIKNRIIFKVFSHKKSFLKIQSLLELYRLENPIIEIELIDAELRPELIKEYDITQVPRLVIEINTKDKKKRRPAKDFTELAITNALIKVTRDRDPLILYATGHGEPDLGSKENEGTNELLKIIKNSGYDLQNFNLQQTDNVPEAADLLIIWGPQSALRQKELDAINLYLKNGGKLLTALDPQFKGDPIVEYRNLISIWGLEIPNNLIIDQLKNANGSNGTIPYIAEFSANHAITKGFKDAVFLPLTSSVFPSLRNNNGKNASILGFSSPFPGAWADFDITDYTKGKMVFDGNKDLKGPIGHFGVVKNPKTKSKIVAFGNSSFVINAYRKFPKNFTLFINALNWVADEDRLISLNQPVIEEKPIFINRHQVGLIFYTIILVVPLLLFGTGFFFYSRRRVL